MTSELFSIFAMTSSWAAGGYTDYLTGADAATSGSMLLTSPIWNGYAQGNAAALNDNVIRIPKGCVFKIWESKVTSIAVPSVVHIQTKHMSGTGTWATLETDSADTANKEQRTSRSGRPLVVESHDGEVFVQFLFQNQGSDVTLASYNCEIVELNED